MAQVGIGGGSTERGGDTKISPTSIREFLLAITKAVKAKDYDDLLEMISEDSAQVLQRNDRAFPSETFLGREDDKRLLIEELIGGEFGSPQGMSQKSNLSKNQMMLDQRQEMHEENSSSLLTKVNLRKYRPTQLSKGNIFGSFSSKSLSRPASLTHCSVINIAGRSGMGKTTLARVVYEERLVEEHFDLRVWVQLEGRELDLKHAARGIMRSTMGMPCAVDDLDELDEMVRDTLQGQRCLIVFDGVGRATEDSWLHMKQCWFDFLDLGSKVVITTPKPRKDVCHLPSHAIQLPLLIPSNASSLFRSIAFDTLDILPRTAGKLAAFCVGIPLLLKLFGSLIRYDHSIINLLLDVSLPPSWDASATVLLCVLVLPSYLRQCLAYCALFPKGYALNKEKMVHMWFANGLLKPSAVDIGAVDGDACFHHLLSRSFFTDVTRDQYNNVIEFRIPGLIHGILGDVARVIWRENRGSLGLISFAGEDAARISLAGEYEADHLRVLISSPALYIGGGLDRPLVDFHELTSLDLSCSGIHGLSDDICVLKKLKYLNLSYTLVEKLPDSVTELTLLQTLDLSWCYHLKLLPSGLRGLFLMSHLDLTKCETLSYIPSGIGSLTSLSSMPLFVLGKDHDSARLQELGKLNQLKGTLEIRNLENVREVLEAQDAKLDEKGLQQLELSWSQNVDDCFEVVELLQPNQQLEVLGLRGYRGSAFPKWISSMKNLVKISITDCGCQELPSLGRLPLLKELQLRGMAKLKYIGPKFYGKGIVDAVFPSLERLEVYDLPSLLKWSANVRAFLSLKFVTIEGCSQLSSLPPFPTLHGLVVLNSNESILRSVPNCTSLLINGTEVWNLRYVHSFGTLKKLILCSIPDKSLEILHLMEGEMFTSLEHLGILHCNELKYLYLKGVSSLKKLHVVDCPDLLWIFPEEKDAPLRELVVEDCPRARANVFFHLRKLTVRNCNDLFSIFGAYYHMMERLQYLSINGCPRLERELRDDPDLVSRIPVAVVGNQKAKKYEGTRRGIRPSIPPLQPVSSPTPTSFEKEASLRKKILEKEASLRKKSFDKEASLGKERHTQVRTRVGHT